MAELTAALDLLRQHRNRDGGWPYLPGRSSRIEPTCWGLLALANATGQSLDIGVLRGWRRESRWLLDIPDAPINYAFNALAGLTFLAQQDGLEDARTLAGLLLDVRGLRLPPSKVIRQDNSLQAWPWVDGTFSWVEPTALSLLLLKKVRRRVQDSRMAERVSVGERMLVDRACAGGGWNYGGANVYGQNLAAYVPTTALGLLALQDRADAAAVVQARAWLLQECESEASLSSIGLSLIALNAHREPAARARQALEQLLRRPDATASTTLLGVAVAVYALSGSRHVDAFTL